MAPKKKQTPPPPAIQFNPPTLSLLAATLLVGIIVGIFIGKGAKQDAADEPAATAASKGTAASAATKPTAATKGKTKPARVSQTDSPFLDAAAVAKFEGKDKELTDYKRAADFVGRRNARAAGPILDRLASAAPEASYQEEISLLQASNKVNQNLPQEALDALNTWRGTYPESRLMAQADLIEGKAYVTVGKGLMGGADTATGPARTEYDKAKGIFEAIPKKYASDDDACGEALYNLGAVHTSLGDNTASLAAYDQLVDQYPKHSLAVRALYSVANGSWRKEDYPTAKKYFQKIVDKYPSDGLAKRSKKNIKAISIIGQPAAELAVDHWLGGGKVTSADMKGKVVLLNFWNEWCPHCRREMPKTQKLAEKYRDQGLVVIAVTKHTKSQTDEKVTAFLDEHGITLPCAVESDGYKSSKDFGVTGVPAGVVIDRSGNIAWRNHPARLSEERIKQFLAD